jgi:Na+-transporting methylmalonyl-CoA/oxaloacetate decarboxylase gamma subunit
VRFVFAIVSFVLAALMIGLGIGQRTFLAGPEEVTAATTETTTTPVTVIDGSALNAFEQAQTLEVSGSPTISAAYGNTTDVLAWIGEASYTHVTYNAEAGELVSTVETGTEATVPALAGSDLWLREYSAETALRMRVNLPEDASVIAISDGTQPAPSAVSVSWPLDNSAPSSGPLVIAGAGFLLLGLILLIWALNHVRRSRGPRRTQQKPPKMPKLPRQPRYKPVKSAKSKAITTGKGRRTTRRVVATVPMILVGSLALSACSIGGWPTSAGSSAVTPTPTATGAPVSEIEEPSVSEAQATRIISEIGTVVAQADSTRDKDLIATRLTGPALELRLANYAIATADATVAETPTAIPSDAIELFLPQQPSEFPRTIFAVVQQPAAADADPAVAAVAPTAMMLVQEDARSNYKVEYAVALQAGVVLPKVAPETVGAAPVSPDSKFLQMAPASLAAAYVDVLMKDTASEFYGQFDVATDSFIAASGLPAKTARIAGLATTAQETIDNAVGVGEPIAMATADSGAVVAVQITENDTVKPVKEGAAAKPSGATKALLGKDTSTKGVSAIYSTELLFYIPSANEPGLIKLLGFTQSLVEAKELP